MCKIESKLKRQRRTLSSSETDLHFVGIPSDSQGLVCSSGHGVILNHYHLHSCSLLQGYNQTEVETASTALPSAQKAIHCDRWELCHISKYRFH